MHHRNFAIRLLAAVLFAVGLPAALALSSASAQTPDAYVAACPSSSPTLKPPSPPSDAQLQQWQTQFAEGLSQALNQPLATVQQGLAGITSSTTLQPPIQTQDPLTVASTQLNVPLDALVRAVQSADQTVLCSQELNAPAGGNAFFIGAGPSGPAPIDPSAFFSAVAQNLGQGLTGQQVQAAFIAGAPSLPDPSALTTQLQNQLSQLATSLGVSTDALKSAIKSLAATGGCLPPNTLGGFRLATKQVAGPPPPNLGADRGPIVIPFGNGSPSRLPGNPGDPLGLGLMPCGVDVGAS